MKSQLFPFRRLPQISSVSFSCFFRPRIRAAAWVTLAGAMFWGPLGEASAEEVVAVIRTSPPKELSEKILSVARKIQPGPQVEALPFMLGGMLGDPTLEGVSATANVGVALISHGEDVAPVLVVQLPEGSPLRESLPNLEMQLRDSGGWTFALPKDYPMTLVDGKEKELIAAVSQPRRYDVELTADAELLANAVRGSMDAMMAESPEAAKEFKPMLEAFTAEVESVADFRTGLNLSAELMELVYFASAKEGTALAGFLNQTRPTDLSFAKFVPTDGAVAYLGGFDVEASRKYLDHIFEGFSAGEGEFGKVIKKIQGVADEFLKTTNGATAGVLSLDGMRMNMTQISPSTMNDAALVKSLRSISESMGTLLAEGAEMDSAANSEAVTGLMPKYEFLENQLQVDGVPIHIVRTELEFAPTAGEEAAEGEAPAAFPAQKQEIHYALADGYLVAASDAATISTLVRAVKSGEPVENNLASAISVGADDLFEMRIDLVRYFGGAMAQFMTPEVAEGMRRLEERGLEPVRATMSASGGSGEFRMKIPVDSVVAAYRTVSEMMTEMQQDSTGGMDDPTIAPGLTPAEP